MSSIPSLFGLAPTLQAAMFLIFLVLGIILLLLGIFPISRLELPMVNLVFSRIKQRTAIVLGVCFIVADFGWFFLKPEEFSSAKNEINEIQLSPCKGRMIEIKDINKKLNEISIRYQNHSPKTHTERLKEYWRDIEAESCIESDIRSIAKEIIDVRIDELESRNLDQNSIIQPSQDESNSLTDIPLDPQTLTTPPQKEEKFYYCLQIMAFKNEKNAQEEKKRWSAIKFPAFMWKNEGYYKICIGQYKNKAEIEKKGLNEIKTKFPDHNGIKPIFLKCRTINNRTECLLD